MKKKTPTLKLRTLLSDLMNNDTLCVPKVEDGWFSCRDFTISFGYSNSWSQRKLESMVRNGILEMIKYKGAHYYRRVKK
jgi:hypothetical protein